MLEEVCMNFVSSLLKLSCLTEFMMYFSELHLTYVYVLSYMSALPKILLLFVTESIYDKTGLFRIISVYITTEVYFGYVINYCEAD
jgi:hypothetical protein